MPAVIQFRRDTASNWTTNNPTMASGEMGIETDTDKYKIGDGSTAWTGLGYSSLPATAIPDTLVNVKGDLIAATADDTVTRLAAGANTYVLTADSTEATGLKWAAGTTGDITEITAGTLIDITAATGPVPTVNVDLSEASTSTSDADGDYFIVTDTSSAQFKLTKGNIALSGMNNDSGWTTNVGDITAVVAGTNIGGGATSGSATINLAIDAEVDCADQLLTTPIVKDYAETVVASTSSGTSQTLVLTAGNVIAFSMTGNCTFTMPSGSTLQAGSSLTLILTQDGTGSRTGAFTSVKWAGGTAPTLTTTATSGIDILTFYTFNGGASPVWYGFVAGAAMA